MFPQIYLFIMRNVIIFILLLFTSCTTHTQVVEKPEEIQTVIIDTTKHNLVIYKPQYDSISLECFKKVEPSTYENAIFCCTAAFTLDYGNEVNHYRICGEHSSDGVFYNNPPLKRNTGIFIYYDNGFRFIYKPEMNREEQLLNMHNSIYHKGCAFTQEMMIHNYRIVKTTKSFDNYNRFRALCEYENELCIIDSKEFITFGDFVRSLNNIGVKEALYMDMGGWDYSWYRPTNLSQGESIQYSSYHESITNLLVFYK